MNLTFEEIFGIVPGRTKRDPEARDYPTEKFSRHLWGDKVSKTPQLKIRYVRCKRCRLMRSKHSPPRYSRIGKCWSLDRPDCIREIRP